MTNAYAIPGLKATNIYNLKPSAIINTILDYRNQPKEQVLAKTRKREFVYTRKLITHFLYKYTPGSDRELVQYLSPAVSERTSIIHLREDMEDLLHTDPDVRFDVAMIKERLQDL